MILKTDIDDLNGNTIYIPLFKGEALDVAMEKLPPVIFVLPDLHAALRVHPDTAHKPAVTKQCLCYGI